MTAPFTIPAAFPGEPVAPAAFPAAGPAAASPSPAAAATHSAAAGVLDLRQPAAGGGRAADPRPSSEPAACGSAPAGAFLPGRQRVNSPAVEFAPAGGFLLHALKRPARVWL